MRESIQDQDLIFLPRLKRAKEGIAARILHLASAPASYPQIDFEKAAGWCEEKTGKQLAPSQKRALKQALTSRVLVLTGGPGVGKTTLASWKPGQSMRRPRPAHTEVVRPKGPEAGEKLQSES